MDRATLAGDAAYRVLIPKGKMAHDEEALRLLDENVGMRWMAPSGDYMAYLPGKIQHVV